MECVISAPTIMRSFRLLQRATESSSREFSISSLNKLVNPLGTDQRKKGLCKRTAWVLLDEFHIMRWQRGYCN